MHLTARTDGERPVMRHWKRTRTIRQPLEVWPPAPGCPHVCTISLVKPQHQYKRYSSTSCTLLHTFLFAACALGIWRTTQMHAVLTVALCWHNAGRRVCGVPILLYCAHLAHARVHLCVPPSHGAEQAPLSAMCNWYALLVHCMHSFGVSCH